VGAVWLVLLQFVFRLTFGMALAMAATSPRLVTSGFFRVHLWVLMGLNTFAGLAVYAHRDTWPAAWPVLAMAVASALLCYIGSVIWLYEAKRAGWAMLPIVAILGLAAAMYASLATSKTEMSPAMVAGHSLQIATSGALLGAVVTAMLLGHWYLNTPGMALGPLRRLLIFTAAAVALRGVVCASGLIWALSVEGAPSPTWSSLVALRWLSGLAGVLLLTWLAWRTLLIPNTQSATGILYAAVIVVFMGELSSQFLSLGTAYPL
jgi:hypothetical protein